MVVVTFKYVFFLMRADNKGEGGTLSLMALAQHAVGRRSAWIFMLGVCGAALFYGDGIITPAISVLSAVEGLQDAPGLSGKLDPFIVPIAAGVLVAYIETGPLNHAHVSQPAQVVPQIAQKLMPGALFILFVGAMMSAPARA